MKDNMQLIGQVILIVLGPLLAKHNITIGNKEVDDVLGAISELAGIIWKFVHWNKTPDAQPVPVNVVTKQSGNIRLGLMFLLSALSALALVVIVGCAAIQPGQDPIVVNVERAQTIAAPTFDLVLETDNANRTFWKQNVPAFHGYCEWLRQRQLAFLADGTPTNVQRAIAMQLNLDKVKLDYKASKVDSNAVLEVLAALTSAENQANAWLVVMTNAAPKIMPAAPPEIEPSNAVLIIPSNSTLEKQ